MATKDDDNYEFSARMLPLDTPRGFQLPLETEAHLASFALVVDRMKEAEAKEMLKLSYRNFKILQKLVAYWAKHGF